MYGRAVITSNYCYIFLQTVSHLQGKTENPCVLSVAALNEQELISLFLTSNTLTGVFLFYLHKFTLFFLLENIALALENAHLAKKYLVAAAGMFIEAVFYFYDSLTAIANYSQELSQQSELIEYVTANQYQLKSWAEHAPMNYLHKYHLVEAEKYRILGKKSEAIENYDFAISLAKKYEYINEEALANELAAKFYLGWGKEEIAQVYMTNAYYCYSRWGAKAKVDDLEKRYYQLLAFILNSDRDSTQQVETITLMTANTRETTSTNACFLDLAGIIKATHAISSEIKQEKLLSTLMRIILENTGAIKSTLILLRDSLLTIEVTASISSSNQKIETTILPSIPLEEYPELPESIIYYVKNILTTLVIDDATKETNWTANPYIQQEKPKSILCTPIIKAGKLIGILYLENSIATGTFTIDRVELVNILTSTAAISLENASLYQASQQALSDLKQAQLQLVQSEKMSALGNLFAGVAHEINNPIGFIAGNIQPALDYVKDIFSVLDLYQEVLPEAVKKIEDKINEVDLDYLRADLPKLLHSMEEAVQRIISISNSLRTFSRADTDNKIAFNIHDGIDSTLLILKHRLKANENRPEIQIIKKYGSLSQISCFPGQLNQVFMNLLANAIDALEESNVGYSFKEISNNPNQITVTTTIGNDGKQVIISIKDNGIGIDEEVKKSIFDNLFTTKPVGKGTGLGLAIVRQIIVEKHGGSIEVNSVSGQGAEFVIKIPNL